MKLVLNDEDIALLNKADITLDPDKNYSEDEILDFLEKIYEVDNDYAMSKNGDIKGSNEWILSEKYYDLGNKISAMITE